MGSPDEIANAYLVMPSESEDCPHKMLKYKHDLVLSENYQPKVQHVPIIFAY